MLGFWFVLLPFLIIGYDDTAPEDSSIFNSFSGCYEHVIPGFTIVFDFLVSKVKYNKYGILLTFVIVCLYAINYIS